MHGANELKIRMRLICGGEERRAGTAGNNNPDATAKLCAADSKSLGRPSRERATYILFLTPLLVFLKMHTSPASSTVLVEQPDQAQSWKEHFSAPSFTRQPHLSTEMMPDS